ncbi:MAG: hypothetical protein WC455_09800 [Dehalococcoidia bacterium]|jgi:hypothetical protein
MTQVQILAMLEKMASAVDDQIKGQKVETNPSEAQKMSGNYPKAHIRLHGLDISIENPKGSTRRGKSKDGKEWSNKMHHHYGYFKQTEGKDKDHIDVFIGSKPESDTAFVVNQVNPGSGVFDEHKVMMGFSTQDEAEKAYLSNYEKGWKGLGSIEEVSVADLKVWLKSGKTKTRFNPKSLAKAAACRRTMEHFVYRNHCACPLASFEYHKGRMKGRTS